MIKKLLTMTALLMISNAMNAQAFSLSYQFSNVTSTTGVIDPTPTSTVTGVTSGSWTTVGTGSASSGSNYFSFTQWGTGATNGNNTTFTGSIDPGKYYELTLTPQTSYMISLTNMSFGASRSGTGVRRWAVRTNKDNYTANIAATYTPLNGAATSSAAPLVIIEGGDTFFWKDDAFSTSSSGGQGFANNNICNVNFSGSNYTDQINPYTIRVYAWDAEGTGGTFRMDSVVINGTATFSVGVGLPKISHDLNASFKLYPNPAENGVVFLEPKVATGEETSIEVTDITGAIRAQESQIFVAKKVRLDLNHLSQGTYFVRFKNGNSIHTEKLMIIK